MSSNVKVTPEVQDEIRRLRALGVSYYKITKRLGVSSSTVSRCAVPGARERNMKAIQKYREAHPGLHNDNQLKYNLEVRTNVITLLGSKCSNCGETDVRILEVNHIDGGGREDRRGYKNYQAFYAAILSKKKNVGNLDLLCANCNVLYEYQRGKRGKNGQGALLHNRVINALGGKCCRCGNNDLRVLEVNHVRGGSSAEFKRHHPQSSYRTVLSGERITGDLNILCANCNILYEYEKTSSTLPLSEKEVKSEERLNG